MAEITADQVSEFLRSHPDFLERYVMEEAELEQLERWIIRRSQRLKKKSESATRNGRKTSLSRWKFCVHADKRQMLQDLTHSLQLKPNKNHVLWELANCICSAVNADGFRLYLPDPSSSDCLIQYLGQEEVADGNPLVQKFRDARRIPTYVARTREPVRFSRGATDPRFPEGISDEGEAGHVLCQAVMYPDGQLAAVLELWRRESESPFHEEDEEIGCSYLVWGGIALHYAHLYLNMSQQRKLNDFLLAVVKSIFQDMVSMDLLVMKVMNFAQRLVDADRASLFLVDAKNKELYATIFDVGVENEDSIPEEEEFARVHSSKEIRFPLGTGIAGQVALTGEVLNIRDAYSDARFNRTVDQLTGYKTNTILCMPIFIRGSIIGVVQMVNKHSGLFTKEDEEAFETFAVYCGLALHHATLYDKIRRSEQKYRVALEVLSYHNSCTEEEVYKVKEEPPQPADVDNYYFNPFKWEDYEKARFAMFMFKDLFGLTRFDQQSLTRFILTVRKNYRRVPYHNWTHGFSVAHCMYCIIKHSGSVFRPNEYQLDSCIKYTEVRLVMLGTLILFSLLINLDLVSSQRFMVRHVESNLFLKVEGERVLLGSNTQADYSYWWEIYTEHPGVAYFKNLGTGKYLSATYIGSYEQDKVVVTSFSRRGENAWIYFPTSTIYNVKYDVLFALAAPENATSGTPVRLSTHGRDQFVFEGPHDILATSAEDCYKWFAKYRNPVPDSEY